MGSSAMRFTDYITIRKELVRAIRGSYSQERLSKLLGFRSNPIYRWESGSNALDWAQFVDLCAARRYDINKAVQETIGLQTDPKNYKALVLHLIGKKRITEISSETGLSRFVIYRWLANHQVPKLDEVLQLLDAHPFLLMNFVGSLVSTSSLPSLQEISTRLLKQRAVTESLPEAEAILACLGLQEYLALETHQPGFVAKKLGIPLSEEERGLALLCEAGMVSFANEKYAIVEATQQSDRTSHHRAHIHWLTRSLRRAEDFGAASSSAHHSVLCLSSEGVSEALKALRDCYNTIRSIAKDDRGNKIAVRLFSTQMIDLLEAGHAPHKI
jgi:DNA-binding phage protein